MKKFLGKRVTNFLSFFYHFDLIVLFIRYVTGIIAQFAKLLKNKIKFIYSEITVDILQSIIIEKRIFN